MGGDKDVLQWWEGMKATLSEVILFSVSRPHLIMQSLAPQNDLKKLSEQNKTTRARKKIVKSSN